MTPEVIPGLVLVLVLVVGGWWCCRVERRAWNAGHCQKDGSRWEGFDMDSQGGRGYVCEHGHYMWISWPVDKRPWPEGEA